MNEKLIHDYLISHGLSEAGAAGLMGNLYAESGLNPMNLQDTGNKKLGMTDEQYVQAVDSGTYTKFVHDGFGIGLSQTTFWTRKQNMLNFARQRGVSISDLNMQLDFLMQELNTSYRSVLQVLISTQSVRQASDIVLTQFEKPKIQDDDVKSKRYSYSLNYYNMFAAKKDDPFVMLQKPQTQILDINKSYPCNPTNHGGSRQLSQIKYIVIHYTGNTTDKAINNVKYFQAANRKASAHYFVDELGIFQSVADNIVAWSVGGSKYPNVGSTGGGKFHKKCTNQNSISIECCSTNGEITEKTLQNVIKLVKILMEKYNISINNVIRHFDVTGKNCPGWTLRRDEDFEKFKLRISGIAIQNTVETAKARVISNSRLRIRKEPTTNSEIVGHYLPGETINVLLFLDGWAKTEKGYVAKKFIKSI